MLRGLWRLTWLEIKIFVREPLGVFGSVGMPVLIFVVLGQVMGDRLQSGSQTARRLGAVDLPVFAALLIAVSVVLSLVTIISIYRESGILKRLRATPLRPVTILTAHVLVKLLFTTITLGAMLLAGRRFYPLAAEVPVPSFMLALLYSTACVLSIGFLIASVVPTARFAQPLATLILYPMFGVCGLFVPVDALPNALQLVSRIVPLTYAASLLRGVWIGEGWMAHGGEVAMLALFAALLTAVSAKVFRWE